MRRAALFVAIAACSIPSHELVDGGGVSPVPDASVGGSGGCSSWGSAGCVTALVAGYHRTCAIAGGNLYCWGYVAGTGNMIELSPQRIEPSVDAVSSSADTVESSGVGETCLLSGGALQCWGDGGDGQQDGNITSVKPTNVAGTFTQIGAGADHICGNTGSGVSCWGAIGDGQVGSAISNVATCVSGQCTDTATQVYADMQIDAIAAGLSHTCALDATGSVSCWGLDSDGQLGNTVMGGGSARDALYNTLPSGTGVVQISAGDATTCAVRLDQSWACWGAGGNGQLGNGGTNDSVTPIFGSPIMFAAISTGTSSTCGITPMGDVECWGDNSTGVSGSDFSEPQETTPRSKGLSNATLIAVGNDHACAALANGEIECWGEAYEGALGTGSASYAICPNLASSVQCTAMPQLVQHPANPF
ncbi:MAG TPA: hypothetical protein VGG28_00030 [Kofleriaceae bacterium]|jgi:alpha-tubulin suppressor-like RCC1 family protein